MPRSERHPTVGETLVVFKLFEGGLKWFVDSVYGYFHNASSAEILLGPRSYLFFTVAIN